MEVSHNRVLPIEFLIIAPLYLGLNLEIVVLQYSTRKLFLFLVLCE